MRTSAFITGVSDVALTAAERAFVREARPWGLILFKRNIETPAQVVALVASFREAVGTEAPVLVDQEGGRVQRIGPPHWPSYPAAAVYGALYQRDQTTGPSRTPPSRLSDEARRVRAPYDQGPIVVS